MENKEKGGLNMWVIFLFSSMVFAIIALIIVYMTNKIWLQMKKDEAKLNEEIKNKNKRED